MAKITTQRELAALMGVSEVAVHKWLKHEDWCFGRAPWPRKVLAEVREWRVDPSAYVWGRMSRDQRRDVRRKMAAEYRRYGLMSEAEAAAFIEGRS